MVPGAASVDDPTPAEYWADRRHRKPPPLDGFSLHLLRMQHGRCPLCGGLLLYADREPESPFEWEEWFTATRKALRKHLLTAERPAGTSDGTLSMQLTHSFCWKRSMVESDGRPVVLPAYSPEACLSPVR